MERRELIFKTLQDLGDMDFNTFKWFLRDKGIPKSQVENAERTDIADKIVHMYPGDEAQIMVDVLKKIDRNDLVERFTTGLSRAVVSSSGSVSPTEPSQSVQSPTSSTGSADFIFPASAREPQTREEFLQYARPLSLNLNTVHNWVALSENNRKMTHTEQEPQGYHDDEERFMVYTQALCTEGLTDRCYWEVKWTKGAVVAVSYNDIDRDEAESLFGHNIRSWALICMNTGFAIKHKKKEVTVCGPRESRVVGVYLDHSAGTLSFYSVELDGMSLIHRVKASFKQPLHPGIGPFKVGSTGELREIWPSG